MTDEHEFEPVHGLPERLPDGEHTLWQGSPEWRVLALRAFHAGQLAIYFALLLAWRAGDVLYDGRGLAQAALSVAWLLPLALLALGIVAAMAWLMARTAVYTITNRRVVMRIGIVLSVTFNLPFASIAAAGLRSYRGGTGDIPLTLSGGDRIAYLHLWPHARPWRVARPEPMLRSIPDAAGVAAILTRAVAASASQGMSVRATVPMPKHAGSASPEAQSLVTQ